MEKSGVDKIKEMARRVARELYSRGFILQMYCAYSTNSIYIKLDYGVCHSIRISDHDGKSELKYRYNIIKGKQPGAVVRTNYARYFYPFTQPDKMIEDIVNNKAEIIRRYGQQSYINFMNKNKRQVGEVLGFWTKSTLIQCIEDIDRVLDER